MINIVESILSVGLYHDDLYNAGRKPGATHVAFDGRKFRPVQIIDGKISRFNGYSWLPPGYPGENPEDWVIVASREEAERCYGNEELSALLSRAGVSA